MAERPHVLIVGSGIVGASIAWHLASNGARVTVVDAAEPGGVATRNSWAWINATWGNPEPYFRLRVRAMDEWRRLEREVPGVRVAWAGGLSWELPPAELAAFEAQHTAWGYAIRRVGRDEIARMEPYLAAPPEMALHAPGEGVVEPLATAQALLDAARSLGAVIVPNTKVRRLEVAGGRVTGVQTDAGHLAADEVIVAAGVETATLAATAGVSVPMIRSPALVLWTRPYAKRLNGLLIPPAMELRQTADGRFVAVTAHDEANPGAAAALFETIRRMIASSDALAPDRNAIAYRPMTKDHFPAVGRADGIAGLYVAVTHSGITLAPTLGRCIAEEILEGRRDRLLEPYGLRRFV
jgi:glycine/D-amino acid oxidase-like deaminating enzyme